MKFVKKSFVAVSMSLYLVMSCQSGEQKEGVTTSAPSSTSHEPSIAEDNALPFTLQYNTENNRFKIIENKDIRPITEKKVAFALNTKYPEIKIEVEKKSNDTLFVRIADATNLTQSIGITGATSYLIEATYGFTSVNGIHVVNYSFTEGDHASPGSYTRESFSEFFK
jgi:hypothetical protein